MSLRRTSCTPPTADNPAAAAGDHCVCGGEGINNDVRARARVRAQPAVFLQARQNGGGPSPLQGGDPEPDGVRSAQGHPPDRQSRHDRRSGVRPNLLVSLQQRLNSARKRVSS